MRRIEQTANLLIFVATLVFVQPAWALKFDRVDPKELPAGVRSALWVRDCGRQGFQDKSCREEETGFYQNDSVRLTAALTASRYDEVWLASDGGDLNEGIAVGQVLRRFQSTVRVPPNHECVSSCTVAFLGGVFRYVDYGATYQVHSASKFLNETDEDLADLLDKPEANLDRWAAKLQLGYNTAYGRVPGAREWAQLLMTHFQKAVHPLGQLPPGVEESNRERFRSWLQNPPPNRYRNSSQLKKDADDIRREGAAKAQEILMRLERDMMQQAIEELSQLVPSLGPRAGPALKMLEAMYTSPITMTASLNQETLLQMGYITKIVVIPKP